MVRTFIKSRGRSDVCIPLVTPKSKSSDAPRSPAAPHAYKETAGITWKHPLTAQMVFGEGRRGEENVSCENNGVDTTRGVWMCAEFHFLTPRFVFSVCPL